MREKRNYIKELNAFHNWLETNPLNATTQTLWYQIMHIANKTGWLDEFTIANITLQAKAGISENTLNKHRNILVQLGRIDYTSRGKNKAGKYSMNFFTSNNEAEGEVIHEVERAVVPAVEREVKAEALTKLNKTKQNKTKQDDSQPLDLEINPISLWTENYNFPNAIVQQDLFEYQDEFGSELLCEALSTTIRNGIEKKGAWAYTMRILETWKSKGIATVEDVKKHEEQRQQSFSKSSNTNYQNSSSRKETLPNWAKDDFVEPVKVYDESEEGRQKAIEELMNVGKNRVE